MIHILMHRERHLGHGAIDRAGGSVEQMTDAVMAARLQDVDEALDIALHIGLRIDQGVAHARLGGEVDHDFEAVVGEQPRDARGIGQVDPRETESEHRLEPGKARLLKPDIIVVVDIIETDDVPALLQKRAGEVKANKACGAGDENWGHRCHGLEDRVKRAHVSQRRRCFRRSNPLPIAQHVP